MSNSRGFTLIELLVVMAVLIVLASTVLAAVNPVEHLRRATDTKRISSVVELGKAMHAYSATRLGGAFPTGISSWQSNYLVGSSEIGGVVSVDPAPENCTTNSEGNLCYESNGTDAVIWTVLEAQLHHKNSGCVGSEVAVVAWIGSRGRVGTTCVASAVTVPSYGAVLN